MYRRIRDARDNFARVFAESYLGRAWIAVHVAELRHAHAAVDVSAAFSQLGLSRPPFSRPAGSAVVETLAQIVDRAAADAIGQELAARDAQRAAYIAGTSEG